jgi:hypothetical protein
MLPPPIRAYPSPLAQAVSDLLADVEKPKDYADLLKETASVHGLNPDLVDRKFRETHGDREAAIQKKIAALNTQRRFNAKLGRGSAITFAKARSSARNSCLGWEQ